MFRIAAISVACIALSALAAARADARTVSGTVYVDRDGDGVLSAGDAPVPDVLVAFDEGPFARTDAGGRYTVAAPAREGLVWVRTPDGYAPGPVWAVAPATGEALIDLALTPAEVTGPLTFVVLADSHIGKEEYGKRGHLDAPAFRHSLDLALDLTPAPAFYTIVGDITNRDTAGEVKEAAGVLRAIDLPFVPVAGNHDWVDKGDNYRKYFGPPTYSFDVGGVHFVVLNDNPRTTPNMQFLRRDLGEVTDGRLVVAFVHRPPEDRVSEQLAQAGIDYLFTGHWHSNRYVRTGDMVQINTEPIIRGGIDHTPAGYRIVTVEGRSVSIAHRTVVEEPVATVTWPGASCVPAGPLRAIAAVQVSAADAAVTATLDGGAPVAMRHAGGWAYVADLGDIAPGAHSIALSVDGSSRAIPSAVRKFETCETALSPQLSPWPQLAGGPARGAVAAPEIRPPLRALWSTPVGAHLQGGSPVVADGRVFASLVDLTDGDAGGVVARDARTGAELWRYTTGHSVRNAPAVSGDRVVVGANDGVLHALDASTGARVWTYDLGAGVDDNRAALNAAPTIADGVVYAGVLGRFAAIDLATGAAKWTDHPSPKGKDHASHGAAAVGDGVVVAPFGLGSDGVRAWDTQRGKLAWKLPKDVSANVNAAPVIRDGVAYVVNASTEVHAVDLSTGNVTWKHKVHEDATPFSLASAGTPALAGDLLVVPTQYESLAAVDVTGPRTAWTAEVGVAGVHVSHNKRLARSIPGAPAVTGDVVWTGAADGTLRAFDLATGRPLWRVDLGAPVLAGPAPAGDVLVVSTFDGTVRAFAHDPDASYAPPGQARGNGLWFGLGLAALGLVAFGVMLWRGKQ